MYNINWTLRIDVFSGFQIFHDDLTRCEIIGAPLTCMPSSRCHW